MIFVLLFHQAVHTGDAALFDAATSVVYACLMPGACVANATADRPSDAYRCTPGHRGVLCAACDEGWFYKDEGCKRCDAGALSPAFVIIIVGICVLALGTGLYRWWARRHQKVIVARLHALRRELRRARKRERADRARRRGQQRGGAALLGAQCAQWGVALRKASLHAVHESVVAARDKLFDLGGESTRIILNASKCYSHLPVVILQQRTFLDCGRPVLHSYGLDFHSPSRVSLCQSLTGTRR